MPESRVTSNQLEVLSSANRSRVTSTQLEVLHVSSIKHSQVTSVQLEVLVPIWGVNITGVATPPTGVDITVLNQQASGLATSYDVHAELTPGITPGPGNLIGSFPASSLPQVLSLLGLNAATYYWFKVVENNPSGTIESNEIVVETDGYGTPPILTVDGIDNTSAILSVQLDSQYTEVHYVVTTIPDTYYLTPVFEVTDASGSRWSVQATPLIFGTTYKVKANWLGPLGWSSYSNEVTFVTAASISFSTYGTILKPRFGESVRGTSYQITWPALQGGETATLSISDDLGASWSVLASGLLGTAHTFNPSLYTDGQDYLLKLIGNMGTVYYQLCFYVDNALTGTNYWHDTGGYNVDIYDPAQFVEGLNVQGRWFGHVTGSDFACVSPAGGVDPTALITKAIRRHTDIDITTKALVDSGEGAFWWSRYWAAEGIDFGVCGLLDNFKYVAGFIRTSLFWPYAAWPGIYDPCGPEKGSSTTSKFVIKIESGLYKNEISVPLPRIHARVRTCLGVYDNPNYDIRLKITHPDRVGFPYRIRVRGTAFGLGLSLPSTFVGDYWLIDQTIDLKGATPPYTEYTFDCGCAGPYFVKIHGSNDEPGRAEFETIGASVMASDCIVGAPTSPCAGVPISLPLVPPVGFPTPTVSPVCPIEPCPGNMIVTSDDNANKICK